MSVQKYTKKTVTIEAVQFTKDNIENVLNFLSANPEPNKQVFGFSHDTFDLQINTLEGVHKATLGDYIIKGIKGEFYPCKPDIFELTYDKAPETFLDRLEIEYRELSEKCTKLNDFILSAGFYKLDKENQYLLTVQEKLMNSYRLTLDRRIEILIK